MFKKRGSVDILDIPDLHRRKLIELPKEKELEKTQITKDGFFDLSQNNSINNNQVTNFLSDFASIGATENNTPSIKEAPKEESEGIKDLKWRIENLEFKLEQLIERIDSNNKV